MKELTIVNGKEVKVIDSREVAEMMGKEHKEILQYIEGRKDKNGKVLVAGIKPTLESEGLHYQDYFIESNYKAGTREYKCYLVTKMGCEMLGNKQQGEKGILFTAKYVERFNKMETVIKEKTAITEKHLKDMEKRLENKTRMEMETLVGGYQRALVGMQNQMIDFQKQQQDLMMDFMEKIVDKLTNKPTVVNVKKEKYMTISDIIKGSKYKSATAANNILEKHSIVYREYYTEDGKEKFRTLATDSAIVLGLAINDPQNGYTRVLYTPKGISTVREILGLDDEQQISFDDPKIVNINR